MKKEKTVKTYQRRTKSGKIVTVKQHTAKYDAADKAKELAKKKGAGGELEEKLSKKKETSKVEPPVEDDLGFTKDEFKEWYNGTGSDADKKVAKILKSKFGRTGYRKLEDEAIDNYTARGYGKLMKKLGGEEHPFKVSKTSTKATSDSSSKAKASSDDLLTHYDQFGKEHIGKKVGKPFKWKEADGETYEGHFVTDGKGRYGYVLRPKGEKDFAVATEDSDSISDLPAAIRKEAKANGLSYKNGEFFVASSKTKASSVSSDIIDKAAKKGMEVRQNSAGGNGDNNWRKTSDVPLRKKGDSATGSINVGKRTIDVEVTPTDKGYEVSLYDRKGNIGWLSNLHIKTLSDLSKHVKHEINPKRKITAKLMDSGEIDYGTAKVKSKKLEDQKVN